MTVHLLPLINSSNSFTDTDAGCAVNDCGLRIRSNWNRLALWPLHQQQRNRPIVHNFSCAANAFRLSGDFIRSQRHLHLLHINRANSTILFCNRRHRVTPSIHGTRESIEMYSCCARRRPPNRPPIQSALINLFMQITNANRNCEFQFGFGMDISPSFALSRALKRRMGHRTAP